MQSPVPGQFRRSICRGVVCDAPVFNLTGFGGGNGSLPVPAGCGNLSRSLSSGFIMHLPQHLAIIMDGNGRWAEHRNLPRIFGHRRGVETVKVIVEECRSLGIPYLTLFAFSSENWGRPAEEVAALMELLGQFLEQELNSLLEQKIRLNVIGDTVQLPPEVRRVLERTVAKTAGNREMVLTLALFYRGSLARFRRP
jgi:undecaprenyl diphosphate synthase